MRQAGDLTTTARMALEADGYEVQTARLATTPFHKLIPEERAAQTPELAVALEKAAGSIGIAYTSLGPAAAEHPWSYEVIPDIIAASQNVFVSGMMTIGMDGICLPAIRSCAGIIHTVKDIAPDGFANLRFGALANVEPGGPFFPGGYHAGGAPLFALAIEAADLAVEAFQEAHSIEAGRNALISSVETHARHIHQIASDLSQKFGVGFGGFDFTLAPFPKPETSFGRAMELLGVPAVGLHGSLAAAAIITDALDHARYRRAGFNGLLLPVLEDAVLAERAAQGVLTVKDLLLYSAVCGAGLDTVPLPGDITAPEIEAILLDVAALSQRLKKPLLARLLPVPGKRAGDETGFNFSFFMNSRVMAVQAAPLIGMLSGDETFSLHRR
jgi:hypothetical protein